MNNDYRFQILQENFKKSESRSSFKDFVMSESEADPKFFNWFFGSDADSIYDFGVGLTDEQREEYQKFLNSLP